MRNLYMDIFLSIWEFWRMKTLHQSSLSEKNIGSDQNPLNLIQKYR